MSRKSSVIMTSMLAMSALGLGNSDWYPDISSNTVYRPDCLLFVKTKGKKVKHTKRMSKYQRLKKEGRL